MNIETIEVAGIQPALHAMRNPMNSWEKSDTLYLGHPLVGENDRNLSIKLQQAGPEHCKHLRMVVAYADITAALTWWKQFDTYRFGVEKVSTSTMHKLMSRELVPEDFEPANEDCFGEKLLEVIDYFNELQKSYKEETDPNAKKRIWEYAIQILPQSYLQKRTVMMSYAALRNIVRQREGHKLRDWQLFIEWARLLPESWMIFK